MVLRTEGIDELDDISMDRLRHRIQCVRFWLERFAPESVRFTLYDTPPEEEIESLTDELREPLKAMREDLESVDWNAESIHNAIYEGSRKRDIDPKNTFRAFYRILLGRDRGPRLGFFLSTMEREDVFRKLDIALKDA
jgi:lysyl-tRNA synthetase class 1